MSNIGPWCYSKIQSLYTSIVKMKYIYFINLILYSKIFLLFIGSLLLILVLDRLILLIIVIVKTKYIIIGNAWIKHALIKIVS